MNIKDERTSRLWTFIMKGEIMAFDLDDHELIATRINNKAASWKEVEEYIEKYYVKKDKVREEIKGLEREKQILEDNKMKDKMVYTPYQIVDAEILRLQELLQEGGK